MDAWEKVVRQRLNVLELAERLDSAEEPGVIVAWTGRAYTNGRAGSSSKASRPEGLADYTKSIKRFRSSGKPDFRA